MAHQLALAHSEHARICQHSRADLFHALIDVEEHNEEHQGEAERNLRPDPEAKPKRKDRRQHYAWERVRHFYIRVEDRGYPWLARNAVDGALIEKKMRTLAKLGHPYSEEDFTGAAGAVAGKTEREALIAYLQGLGTNVKPGG